MDFRHQHQAVPDAAEIADSHAARPGKRKDQAIDVRWEPSSRTPAWSRSSTRTHAMAREPLQATPTWPGSGGDRLRHRIAAQLVADLSPVTRTPKSVAKIRQRTDQKNAPRSSCSSTTEKFGLAGRHRIDLLAVNRNQHRPVLHRHRLRRGRQSCAIPGDSPSSIGPKHCVCSKRPCWPVSPTPRVGLTHARDLEGDDILIAANKTAKLVDFGLAELAGGPREGGRNRPYSSIRRAERATNTKAGDPQQHTPRPKGSPWRSSSPPGASPTKHNSRATGPTPNTVCVRVAASSGQRVQRHTSSSGEQPQFLPSMVQEFP